MVFDVVDDQVVRCDQHVDLHLRVVKVLRVQESTKFPFFRKAEVREDFEVWAKPGKFVLPFVESGDWDNDKERAIGAFASAM